MIQQKLVDEISITFPELFIIEKHVKIRFKNRAPSCYFLEVKRWKISQKLNLTDHFCNIFDFIFYAVSLAKTDLHSKYKFNFVFGSSFERNHLLNLFILTLSWRRPLSYRNQFNDLRSKSMDWFLYNNGLRHERVRRLCEKMT